MRGSTFVLLLAGCYAPELPGGSDGPAGGDAVSTGDGAGGAADSRATANDGTPATCPEFWLPFGTSCYRYFATEVSWREAETDCRSMSAHLAVIDEADENTFVASLVPSLTWIGLYRPTTVDTARWVTPEVSCCVQKTNFDTNDLCALIDSTGTWVGSDPCTAGGNLDQYLCEMDGLPVVEPIPF